VATGVDASFQHEHEDAWSHLLLWHQMKTRPYHVKWSNFWPRPSAGSRWLRWKWHCDVLGSSGADCLSLVTADTRGSTPATVFSIHADEKQPGETGHGDYFRELLRRRENEKVTQDDKFTPHLAVLTRVCDSGIAVLGQVDKYVSTSEDRFVSIDCTNNGATIVIHGTSGEQVEVTVAEVVTESITVDERGKVVPGIDGQEKNTFRVRVQNVLVGEEGTGAAEFTHTAPLQLQRGQLA
jgi:hypothetical protein